jgi:hypothetical protein
MFLSGITTAWNQAQTLYNAPAQIQAKVAQVHQDHSDAVRKLNAVLANPDASPAEHEFALNKLRLAQS